jgi:hypothetical protein
MIVLANEAKPVLLMLKLSYLRTLNLRLFKNDITPDGDTEVSDFAEADFPGYAPQTLADLGTPYLNPIDMGQSDTGPHEWTMSGPSPTNVIYGYYATNLDGYLIFAERNAQGPVPMMSSGATYSLIVHFMEDTLRL